MEKQPRMAIEVAEDKSTGIIRFLPASGASGELTLDSDQLLALIRTLGNVRSMLTAGQPIPPLEGADIGGVVNTRWYVQPEMVGEASALCFQHPGFGPLGFIVPIDQVEQMIGLLAIQVEAARSSKAQKPN